MKVLVSNYHYNTCHIVRSLREKKKVFRSVCTNVHCASTRIKFLAHNKHKEYLYLNVLGVGSIIISLHIMATPTETHPLYTNPNNITTQ